MAATARFETSKYQMARNVRSSFQTACLVRTTWIEREIPQLLETGILGLKNLMFPTLPMLDSAQGPLAFRNSGKAKESEFVVEGFSLRKQRL